MIVWQGKGFLGVLVPFLFILAGQFGLDAAMGQGYYSSHSWAPALFLSLSAGAVWLCGYKLNNRPARELIDTATQQKVLLREKHTVFWIPLQHFWVVVVAVALWVLWH